MFNPLIDSLPSEWRGAIIKTDFRQALKVFKTLADKELDQQERSLFIIGALFEKIPDDCTDLWEFVNYYLSGGKTEQGDQGPRVFDFNVDAGRVYAAFRQVYNIDLRNELMHWWIFLELFKSLPRGTHLAEVIEIRGKKITKNMDDESKRALRKAQRAYRIDQEGLTWQQMAA
jgi:hypothetical protein